VSRATAYRELTPPCKMGVLVQTVAGLGMQYKAEDFLSRMADENSKYEGNFGRSLWGNNYI
jgi:hypothetical protein